MIWGGKRESNPQPPEPQSGALPVELFPPQTLIIASERQRDTEAGTREVSFVFGAECDGLLRILQRLSRPAKSVHRELFPVFR